MDQQDNRESSKRAWLQRLKDESWEAELLVSAIAIFGTFKLFGMVEWMTNIFISILYPSQYLIAYGIVFLGLFAISVMASMFVIHFFLRAYWIGLVGLNSVFSDYSLDDSMYSKTYTEKFLTILPKLKDTIDNVDELCSVIFSAAFTALLIYMYLSVVASFYIIIYNLLSLFIPSTIVLIPIIILIILLVLQIGYSIFANTKKNKTNDKIQVRLFKVVRLVSMIMYGPLYKTILQVTMIFGSNFKKKKRLSYLMLLFLLSGSIIAIYQMKETNIPYLIRYDNYFDKTKLEASYYEVNNDKNNFLLTPEIPSDIIKKDVIKVFIPMFIHEKKQRKEICDHDKEGLTHEEEDALLLKCYKEYITVKIDEKEQHIDFLRYTHSRTEQFGLIGYLDLKKLSRGKKNLTIEKGLDVKWSFPFYYTLE
ncbi:hypothetical protein [Tenacibaculum sp. M341]|uniref:hypothetical protein n=1 Tax=Tenacibaculum sp. M341 TaxID=2530339 RepID=UPI001053804F|nr:hypothetical protein [Tenacibaculum sp. M341]TCI95007.1 hypothetical protein EYW44_01405 [Tenacibaculum sp. M341]